MMFKKQKSICLDYSILWAMNDPHLGPLSIIFEYFTFFEAIQRKEVNNLFHFMGDYYMINLYQGKNLKNIFDKYNNVIPKYIILNLLKNKNIQKYFHGFCIRWSSYYGCTEVVKLILKNKNLYLSNGECCTSIKWASHHGYIEIVKLLLEDKRIDPSVDKDYAISWACKNGHTEIVKLLLNDIRVWPSARDNVSIRVASENGHVEVVKLLLEHEKVNPSAKDNEAIILAWENGHTEIVKMLLKDERLVLP